MYNLSAELAKNLETYSTFISSRAGVPTPMKIEVPKVWDLYMDTTRPVGTPLAAVEQTQSVNAPIDYLPSEFESGAVSTVTYRSPVTGDMNMLGLVNDRLKTQARRYPHPITNDMDTLA